MLTIRASKPAEFTQSAVAPHDTVALHANQPEGFVSGMAVIALCCDPVCPSCGMIGRNQDGSVGGSARYRCQHCCKIFSVSSVTRQSRRDAYERWLADIAS